MSDHKPDVLGFCEVCGASYREILNGDVAKECDPSGPVNIQRKIAWRNFLGLTDEVFELLKGD